jgi:TPR repeat protein
MALLGLFLATASSLNSQVDNRPHRVEDGTRYLILASEGKLQAGSYNKAPDPRYEKGQNYWCDIIPGHVSIRVFAADSAPYDIFQVRELIRKAGVFIEKECPKAKEIEVSDLELNWERRASKAGGWTIPIPDVSEAAAKILAGSLKANVAALRTKLLPRAEAGDTVAQYTLGLAAQYASSFDAKLEPDYRAAAQWYEKAAGGGLAEAMYSLAALHRIGRGVPLTDSGARKLLEKAAALGHSGAMVDLSKSYLNRGFFALPEVLPLLEQASQKGNVEAHLMLGEIYQSSERLTRGIVQRNYQKAMQHYQTAAKMGSCVALLNIGGFYFNGDGVTQSREEAAKWFGQAGACPRADDRLKKAAAHWKERALTGKLPSEPPPNLSSLSVGNSDPVLSLIGKVGLVAVLAELLLRAGSGGPASQKYLDRMNEISEDVRSNQQKAACQFAGGISGLAAICP